MTTNQERAAEVIGAWIDDNLPHDETNFGADEGIAQALADVGLLTPDLPEPEMDIDRLIWRVDEEGFVYRKPDGRISTIGVGNPYPNMKIARLHAFAVIAATNHYNTQEKK